MFSALLAITLARAGWFPLLAIGLSAAGSIIVLVWAARPMIRPPKRREFFCGRHWHDDDG